MNIAKRLSLVLTAICITYWSPAQPTNCVMLDNPTYRVWYDTVHHVPAKVFWTLIASDLSGNAKSRDSYFKQDARLPKPRVKHKYFSRSGYVRGHLCPAADRRRHKADMKSTFLLSNIAPMREACNAGAWLQVENFCRVLARQGYRVEIMATSNIDDSCSVIPALVNITVPRSFNKEVTAYGHDTLHFSWLIPNDTIWRVMPLASLILVRSKK